MGKIVEILIIVSIVCLATTSVVASSIDTTQIDTTPADTTSDDTTSDDATLVDTIQQEQHILTEDTLTSLLAKAATPEPPDTDTARDLQAPPSSKWSELRDHLTKLGINLDSMSAVGAAFDPVTKNLLIITLEPGGLLAKKEVRTPEWLYSKIIGSESDESPTDIHRQDGRTYFIITTTYRSTGAHRDRRNHGSRNRRDNSHMVEIQDRRTLCCDGFGGEHRRYDFGILLPRTAGV